MKIRSITYFCNPGFPLSRSFLPRAGDFLRGAGAAFEEAGYEVQTTRLATVPFPKLLGETRLSGLPDFAKELDQLVARMDTGYASLGRDRRGPLWRATHGSCPVVGFFGCVRSP